MPASEPVTIESHALLRWRMQHQGLDPSRPLSGDCVAVVEQLGFLFAPSGSTPYLSLAARRTDFERAELDRAVFDERRLVERRWLKGGNALVAPARLALWRAAEAAETRRWLAQLERSCQVEEPEIRRIITALLGLLREGEASRGELRDALLGWFGRALPEEAARIGLKDTVEVALRLARREGLIGRLRAVPQLDTGEVVFYRPTRWPAPAELDEVTLHERLLLAYLDRWGVGAIREIAWWANCKLTPLRKARRRLEERGLIQPVSCVELGTELVGSTAALEQLAAAAAGPPLVALLPYRDPLLTCTRDPVAPILPEPHRESVHSRWRGRLNSGDVLEAVVLDGRIIGGWCWEGEDIRLHLDERPPAEAARRVEAERQRLALFIRQQLGGRYCHYAQRGHTFRAACFIQ